MIMKVLLFTSTLLCSVNFLLAAEVRLTDLEPTDAQQIIEQQDQSLKYAPKIESSVPAVRYLGDEPHHVLEDIYLAKQYHGQDGLGGYIYGYDVPDISKTEKKKAGGDLRGAYNYIAGNGQEIKVEYWDDGTGFHQIDNVPKILPKQIDDLPAVKAAKEEHLRLWQEQAERNSRPIESPYNSAGEYASGPLSKQGQQERAQQFAQQGQYDAHNIYKQGQQGFGQNQGQYGGQSSQFGSQTHQGGQQGAGAGGQGQFGSQVSQGGQYGGQGSQGHQGGQYSGSHGSQSGQYGGQQGAFGGARPSGSFGGQQSGQFGGQGQQGGQYSGQGQQGQYSGQGNQGQHGGSHGSQSSQYGGQTGAFGGVHGQSGPFGGSDQTGQYSQQNNQFSGKPSRQSQFGVSPVQSVTSSSSYVHSGQSGQYGKPSTVGSGCSGSQCGAQGQGIQYGGPAGHGSGSPGNQYGGQAGQSGQYGQQSGLQGGQGSHGSGCTGTQCGSQGQSGYGQQAGPGANKFQQTGYSSNSISDNYSGQYSENKDIYSQGQQKDNDDQNEEPTGPPKGFFYSFDYPVGIIVSKQGKANVGQNGQADLKSIYDQNKATFEHQVQTGSGQSGSYQAHH